jgi:hypothetical protein
MNPERFDSLTKESPPLLHDLPEKHSPQFGLSKIFSSQDENNDSMFEVDNNFKELANEVILFFSSQCRSLESRIRSNKKC